MPDDQSVLDHIPVVLAYFGADRCNVFANATAGRWFGMSPGEMRGRHVRDLFGDGPYAVALPYIDTYIDAVLTGATQGFASVCADLAGTVHHLHATFSPDLADRDVIGFYVSVIDLDLIGRDDPATIAAMHGFLIAALAERERLGHTLPAGLPTSEVKARLQDAMNSLRHLLAEIRRDLGA